MLELNFVRRRKRCQQNILDVCRGAADLWALCICPANSILEAAGRTELQHAFQQLTAEEDGFLFGARLKEKKMNVWI